MIAFLLPSETEALRLTLLAKLVSPKFSKDW